MDFLDTILPRQGFYCAAKLLPAGGFAHRFFSDLKDLKAHLRASDNAGATMYVAQATFKQEAVDNHGSNLTLPKGTPRDQRKKTRTAALAHSLRNFFVDIDCGLEKYAKDPEKSYPSQQEAAAALINFCGEAHLPFPFLVSSGNGLYAHWAIDEDIPAEKWKALAQILKNVLTAYGFRQDPSRTADAASVLRPVGTTNRKAGGAKPVRQLNLASAEIPLRYWIEALDRAAKAKEVDSTVFAAPTTFRGVDDEFTSGIEGPPSSLEKIANRCAQVARIKDLQGDVSEPLWYSFIGLARFTQEAKETDCEIIHDWSMGHPEYDPDVTNRKIEHHTESGTGPTTCSKFSADSPTECVACPHLNKIKSPIVLGRPEAESVVATQEEKDDLPFGFLRTKEGLFFKGADDTEPVRFYPYDLYVTKLAFDHSLHYETLTIRHQLPVSGIYQEFVIGSHLLHDPKTLLMELAKNHVQVSGKEAKGLMAHFIDTYLAKLRSQRNLATLYSQMGWHSSDEGEKVFVLGETVYTPQDDRQTGFAQNIPPVARAFKSEGDLAEWVKVTEFLGVPGMEPLAFVFLAGAFGAPLLRFTGYSGAMVAMVGKSGLGKTLLGEWILSTYGDPKNLRLLKKDTMNMTFSRLGLYGSLPLYIDEVSNIDSRELSDLLYGITQGRERGRLHRSGQERGTINEWNTIAVVSSNHSLNDKLATLKADASAEINRVVEIKIPAVGFFTREIATRIYRTFYENHGVAGPVYAKFLVENQAKHQANLDRISAELDRKTGAQGEERFWSAVAACAIYGGMIAHKIGLIRFSVAPVMEWLVDQVADMRAEKEDLVLSQVDVLGQMLDDLAGGALICSNSSSALVNILKEPRGPVSYRIEADAQRLYIPRGVIKRYLDKNFGSYSTLREDLHRAGAMVNDGMRKVLGAGTYIGGTQQPCWVIDLSVPALGRQVVGIVKSMTEKREAV